MLNETIIALTTATILASASAAFAYEAPENKIGDSYPLLEQPYQANSAKRSVSAKMTAPRVATTSWGLNLSQFSNPNQYANEAPENRISDRYPLLEQKIVSQRVHGRVATSRHHKVKHST